MQESSRGERGIPDKIGLVGGSEQFGRRLGRKFGYYLPEAAVGGYSRDTVKGMIWGAGNWAGGRGSTMDVSVSAVAAGEESKSHYN